MADHRLIDYFSDSSLHAAGLEFSDTALRYVVLKRHGSAVEVQHFGETRLPEGVMHDGAILDRAALISTLRTMFASDPKRHIHKPRAVYASIPERHAFLKLLSISQRHNDSIDEAVRWETTQHIPYELKDLSIDWQQMPGQRADTLQALVVASPTPVISSFHESLTAAGYETLALELPSLAVLRGFHHELHGEGIELLLHIGDNESFALLTHDDVPTLSSLVHFTVENLRQWVEKQFSLTSEEAFRSLARVGFYKSRAKGVVRNALMPSMNALIARIDEIETYVTDLMHTTQKLRSVVVCGKGSGIAGFTDELSDRLRIEVKSASLPSSVKLRKNVSSFAKQFQPFAVAFGLALGSA